MPRCFPFAGLMHARRSRASLLSMVLLAVLVGICTTGTLFAAPSLHREAPALRGGLHATYSGAAAHNEEMRALSRTAMVDTPWVGLGAPMALLLLASMQSRSGFDRTGRGAFVGSLEDSQPRAGLVLRREQASSVPQIIMSDDSQATSKNDGVARMAIGFFFWYAANVSFNIVNKQALGLFPHAWSVSCIQLAMVVSCSAVGWITGLVPLPRQALQDGFFWKLLPAAICHALGNGLTSVAFSWGSVSFTHVVKCSEPIWMALGIFLSTGNKIPRAHLLALIPIMMGVALASAGEMSFTTTGFCAALASTICFAGRGILSKRLMTGGEESMSPLNVYAMDSALALLFTLPVAALADGQWLASGGLGSLVASGHGMQLAYYLFSTGLAYYAYNAIAFKLLGKLDVVSHAVGNLGKRIFVIGFSVVFFHNPLTMRAAIGASMAIAGSGLYSYVKATVKT